MRIVLRTVLIAVAACTAFGVTAPAVADGDQSGTVTGGDVSGPSDDISEAEREQGEAKAKLAAEYYANKYGSGSEVRVRKAARAYQKAYPRRTDAGIARLASGRASASSMRAGSRYETRVLGVVHHGQLKIYYCGPASGKMILEFLREGPSAVSGKIQNQYNIADADHMRTDINGKTAWTSHLFRIGLNKWRTGKPTGFFVDRPSPNGVEFKQSLVSDIDLGSPFAADTVEWERKIHYNNHPKHLTIGHWLVVRGYADSGDGARFVDSSTKMWKEDYKVEEYFAERTAYFANTYLQTNGITW